MISMQRIFGHPVIVPPGNTAASPLPGVTSAGLTTNVPFNGNVSSGSYSIVGYTPGPSEAAPHGRQEVVGADYFAAIPWTPAMPLPATVTIAWLWTMARAFTG